MKTTKTILTKIVHILIVIFAGKTPAFFTETVAQGTTVSGEIVAPKEWDGLNRNNQRVFGTVTDTVLLDDNKDLSSIRSEQDIYSGGHTNNITVRNKRNQNILGGIAENTVIEDGGRAILEQGEFTNGKGEKSVIVEGGEITHGAKGVFMGQARINNLKISGDVGARASRENPHFSHAYIGQLGQLILSAGKITESTIEGGLLSVAYSEASDTTMKGGSIELGEGGILKRTQMTGGSLSIKDGGLAEAAVVNGGGRMSNYNGTDIGTVVNSGTYTLGDAHSTRAQSNNLTLGNEAAGYIRKGTVNGANLDGQMILGFPRLSSTLKGDVTVGERGQLDVINNGHLDTHEANLNLSGRVNLNNDSDPGKVSRFRKVSMNQGHFYFDYSNSGGFSKNYSILFLETLSGSGTFWMNTDIAGHRGNILHVRGEANGHFGVRVTDSGESPKPEDSLKIIQTGGGDADFTLANQGQVVDVGTYQYHLVPDDHKRGWSLVSHQPQPSEKPQTGSESNPEAPVASSAPEEKEAVLTPVSGEAVAPAVTDETQTGKLAPKAPELKPEAPVTPSVEKEGEKKVAPNRLLSPPTNVSRTNRVPDIPSITTSTAAVLSMSTVGPLIYHSEMAQIQERMSETRQAKTEDTVWVKVMNERQNISQKAGDGYGLRLNGISLGADRTLRLGRSAYTTQGLFFTHGDAKLNFRGKAIGGGNVSSWSAGTYAAYYHDSGFWLDGILKANRFSQEIRGRMTGGGDAFGNFSTLAFGATVRGGKDMLVGEMTFTPYLSLSGLRTTRSSLSLSNGMKGDISAQRSVLGKVGLRALYQTRIKDISVTPWVDVGAEREFIKNNRVRINQRDSFDNDLSGITGAYSLGLSANMSETFNVSATAGYKKGKHIESPWSASLGMGWKF